MKSRKDDYKETLLLTDILIISMEPRHFGVLKISAAISGGVHIRLRRSPEPNSSDLLISVLSMMTDLEKLVLKATDATLTGDNWQYILDTCDRISDNPETNTKEALKLIKARLALKDANVILRTLSLIVAAAENCGSRMKQEIASTSFLQESLIKKLGDKKLHRLVKFRVAEVIVQLNKSFDKDPSLKPIKNALDLVKLKYPQYLSAPPSKPEKKTLSTEDRKNEELELERALKLSVQEYEREQSLKRSILQNKPLPDTDHLNNRSTTSEQVTGLAERRDDDLPGTASIASVKKVCALYDLISYEPDELSFKKGDVITVIESVYRDWWRGMLSNGKVGIFPLNYVSPVMPKTPEDQARELALEHRLVNFESKNVEKLLALLSANPENVSEDEVTKLYNEIVPLKTTLALLIDKYSSRKDELGILLDQVHSQTKLYDGYLDQIVNLRTAGHSLGTLPYPSPLSERPNTETFLNYLEQQPTSAGFGNSPQHIDYSKYSRSQGASNYSSHRVPQTSFLGQNPEPEEYSQYSHFLRDVR